MQPALPEQFFEQRFSTISKLALFGEISMLAERWLVCYKIEDVTRLCEIDRCCPYKFDKIDDPGYLRTNSFSFRKKKKQTKSPSTSRYFGILISRTDTTWEIRRTENQWELIEINKEKEIERSCLASRNASSLTQHSDLMHAFVRIFLSLLPSLSPPTFRFAFHISPSVPWRLFCSPRCVPPPPLRPDKENDIGPFASDGQVYFYSMGFIRLDMTCGYRQGNIFPILRVDIPTRG